MNTWIVPPEALTDDDFEIDENGERGEWRGVMPSEHPNRLEALNLWATYGKKQMQLTIPYTRQPNGKVKNFSKEIRYGFNEDSDITMKNYLWLAALERMRNKDFKP